MKKLNDYEIIPLLSPNPLSDPQISPNGDKIIFTKGEVNLQDNSYENNLWLYTIDNKNLRQFSFSNKDSNPRWSNKGDKILFISSRSISKEKEEKEDKAQIWLIHSDGGEARLLTSVENGVENPDWSPDDKKILFLSKVFKGEKKEDSDIIINRRIDYKWDGRGIFDGERTHLFITSLDGESKQLTDGGFDVDSAAWSSDSENIAFISNLKDTDVMRHLYFKKIYSIGINEDKPKLLWDGEKWDVGRIDGLTWSRDGRYLAFTGRIIGDLDKDIYKNSNVWIIPSEGGEPVNLTESLDRTIRSYGTKPIWSKDSKEIYFAAPDEGAVNIYKVNIETHEIQQIIEDKMTINSFNIDNNRVAFTASDKGTPLELWLKDEEGVKRLTEMNIKKFKEYSFSKPEEFWFTTSEGVRVNGWVMKPHSFQEDEKYPTILSVHGGPHGMYGYSFNHELQVFAKHGYCVVYTNPRASTGYGEKFAAPVYGCWGELDGKDILETLEHVLEKYPYLDSEKLGVTGLSYGGYMTNWLIGHTDKFKAAVARNSLTNMYSAWGTSDIGWMGFEISS
jgi:dipeptidyl aminopeptidase/acylaminoacyl peptidase